MRAFGFKSPLEHLEVFNEFTQAHKWALEAHFHVAIRRKVGFAPAPGDITDSILVGDLECVLPPPTQTRKHLDPASRFRLREDRFKFTPLAEFNNAVPGRTETFDRLYGESRTLVQEIHGWHPLFLGGCPVVYLIWPLGFVTYTCCSIFALIRIPRPPDPMSDESMRHEILEDKLRLATASINSGIVLRAVELHGQPVPGRFVRADEMWPFHPLFKAEVWEDTWDAYLMAEPRPEGADLLDDAIARCTSGLELVELIYVSQML